MKITVSQAQVSETELIIRCSDPKSPEIQRLLLAVEGVSERIAATEPEGSLLLELREVQFMQEFKKFYLWGMNAKFYMGLYFAALVFFVGVLVALLGEASLPLITLLQMLLVSVVIAFVQTLILPDSVDFSRGIFFARSLIWLLISGVLVTVTAIVGGWFAGLPSWCPWLLGLVMVVGCTAVLVGCKFEQDADTVRLNESLNRYNKGDAHR